MFVSYLRDLPSIKHAPTAVMAGPSGEGKKKYSFLDASKPELDLPHTPSYLADYSRMHRRPSHWGSAGRRIDSADVKQCVVYLEIDGGGAQDGMREEQLQQLQQTGSRLDLGLRRLERGDTCDGATNTVSRTADERASG
jgi:hypothetical protein